MSVCNGCLSSHPASRKDNGLSIRGILPRYAVGCRAKEQICAFADCIRAQSSAGDYLLPKHSRRWGDWTYHSKFHYFHDIHGGVSSYLRFILPIFAEEVGVESARDYLILGCLVAALALSSFVIGNR